MTRTRSLAALGALLACACSTSPQPTRTTTDGGPTTSLFGLETRTLDGQPQSLAAYEGKVVLVVNTASKCGLTPQYAKLQELHETYAGRGLVVLGFPCNQFLGQEPGTAEEIATFCSSKYGVSFPLMEKVEVKPGAGQSPVYRMLSERTGAVPDWNFAKYLVARDGRTVRFFGARTDPTGVELVSAIEGLL
jgi:glutathione peroxidase